MRIIVAGLIIGGGSDADDRCSAAGAAAGQRSELHRRRHGDGREGRDRGPPQLRAGARTAWHSHDKGQLIYAETGRMRTGRRGQAFKEYAAGGSEYTAPNVEHWHGATPKEALVQVNIQFGGTTKWLTKTTDDEYNREVS